MAKDWSGLLPCGCGGKAIRVHIPHETKTKITCVACETCFVTTPYLEDDEAKDVWNRAMGWKGGMESEVRAAATIEDAANNLQEAINMAIAALREPARKLCGWCNDGVMQIVDSPNKPPIRSNYCGLCGRKLRDCHENCADCGKEWGDD